MEYTDARRVPFMRVRFHADANDPRPVEFPPPGPYWITGYAYADEFAVIVAYVREEADVRRYWPDASGTVVMDEDTDLHFSDRFPKPDWWGA